MYTEQVRISYVMNKFQSYVIVFFLNATQLYECSDSAGPPAGTTVGRPTHYPNSAFSTDILSECTVLLHTV